MKRKIRYQAKTDLKLLRRINGISKEYVADKIGYTIRSLERMEKRNAGYNRAYCTSIMQFI